MTAVASDAEAKPSVADRDDAAPPDLFEDPRDRHATHMIYGEGHKFPLVVAAVWVVAIVSLGAYLFVYAIPDFARWGN